jgi:NDP-sugar pyrophosphorylase family protein
LIQVAILAGGLASRLGELSRDRPKAMLVFRGKPFLEHQLEYLKAQGCRRFLLCVGHMGEQIENHFGDGKAWGIQIQYSRESSGSLLGTGGALKKASALLDESFFVMYGDSYLKLDFDEIEKEAGRHPSSGLMVVYRNDNRLDRSNVSLRDGFVAEYGYENSGAMSYIDEGVSVLRREFLKPFPEAAAFPLGDVFKRLVAERRLRALETRQRFYEIGSVRGCEEFEKMLEGEKI